MGKALGKNIWVWEAVYKETENIHLVRSHIWESYSEQSPIMNKLKHFQDQYLIEFKICLIYNISAKKFLWCLKVFMKYKYNTHHSRHT